MQNNMLDSRVSGELEPITGTSITAIRIGREEMTVAVGRDASTDATATLAIGLSVTGDAFFRHHPPTPHDLENAIMAVEDEVVRTQGIIVDGARLLACDETVSQVARLAGVSGHTMTLETVEALFQTLATASQGGSWAGTGVTLSRDQAVVILILREFMHHLGFTRLTIHPGVEKRADSAALMEA